MCHPALCNSIDMVKAMNTVDVDQFRDNLENYVDQVLTNHTPLKVTGSAGKAVVVISADDWESERETLYVLQNGSLMKQIANSLAAKT